MIFSGDPQKFCRFHMINCQSNIFSELSENDLKIGVCVVMDRLDTLI